MGRGKRRAGLVGRRRGAGWAEPISTTHPLVAEQWVEAPGSRLLSPDNVSAGSGEPVLWECSAGHRWRALVKNRTLQGQGCRLCYFEGRREAHFDHLSPAQIPDVIRTYQDDLTCTLRDLWRMFGLTRGKARSFLLTHGVEVRPEPPYRISPDDRAQAVALYEAGQTLTQTSAATGLSTSSIVALLDQAGVRRRSASEANRRLFLREDAFHNPLEDAEASYWSGFAMADGAILHPHTFRFHLHHRDVEHLQKLRRFLGSEERTISEDPNRPSVYIAFHSKRLCDDLAVIGVKPRKSLVARVSPDLATSPDFWRGVVDGDGNIRLYKKGTHAGLGAPTLRLEIGSKELLQQFALFLKKTLDLSPPVKKSAKGWKLAIYGPDSVAALDLLYRRDGASGRTALERKRRRALRILEFRDLYPSGRVSPKNA